MKQNVLFPEAPKRFIPPSLEQVTAYCTERHNSVDPEHWVDYYKSNGWRVGRNPMKDWQAAIRTWEKNGKQNGKSKTENIRSVIARVCAEPD